MMQDCGGSSGGGSNGGSGSIEEKGSGGVAASSGLAILSNRSPSSINNNNNNNNNRDVHAPVGTADTISHGHNTINTIQRLATLAGETHALSNTHYTDRSWSKVVSGEKLLADVIADSSRDFRSGNIKSNRGSDNNDDDDSYNNIDTEKDTASSESNGIKTDCQPTEESRASRASRASNKSNKSKDTLIEHLFSKVLSANTLPARKKGEKLWSEYLDKLKDSIFIPRIAGTMGDDEEDEQGEGDLTNDHNNNDNEIETETETKDDDAKKIKTDIHIEIENGRGNRMAEKVKRNDKLLYYGTQKQTVILMDRARHVTFVERTLYDGLGNALTAAEVKAGERRFEFDIDC